MLTLTRRGDAERVAAAIQAELAASTRVVYASAWRTWEAWCAARSITALPSPPEALAAYLAERAEEGLTYSSIEIACSAVSMVEVNLLGVITATEVFLDQLKDGAGDRGGDIVNISSVAGRTARAGNGVYAATKWGMNGWSEGSGYYSAVKAAIEALTLSLRKEVAPLGITAMVVEPGAFRTDFAGRSLIQAARPIVDYADTAGKRRKEHDTAHGTQPGDPAKAAAALVDVVESGRAPYLLLLGNDASDSFRNALDTLRHEVDQWEQTSRSTDLDEPRS